MVQDGVLVRGEGERGLMLPDQVEQAVRQLREAGWVIDAEAKEGRLPVTIRPLLPPAKLRYPKRGSIEGNDRDGQQAA